ncbi:MAG: sulfite exporter TauE/SafE family protein [Saprospiraceae bacterium]|nr:sulfite exporter TauE/SafE family protein [Saprospiraceae bacterium]
MNIDLLIFSLLALLAEIIGTIGGFGSSMLFVPIANQFFDLHSVLGITALFHVVSNLSKIALFKKGIDKKLCLQMLVPSVIFVTIGGILSKYIDVRIAEMILSLFLILISLLFMFGLNQIKPTQQNIISSGALSGFLAGLIGTGGAIRGLTLTALNLEKSVFIATSASIDLAIDLTRSAVYLWNGYITRQNLYLLPILFLIGIVGTWIGKKFVDKIAQSMFKKIVLLLILGIGIYTLSKWIFSTSM